MRNSASRFLPTTETSNGKIALSWVMKLMGYLTSDLKSEPHSATQHTSALGHTKRIDLPARRAFGLIAERLLATATQMGRADGHTCTPALPVRRLLDCSDGGGTCCHRGHIHGALRHIAATARAARQRRHD